MAKLVQFTTNPPKLPPQSLEAEQSLLGGLLLDNRKWHEVIDEVRVQDFYNQNHRLIFTAISGLQDAGDPADVVTTSEWLDTEGKLENAGGLAYIGMLANNTPSTANILTYAKIVREQRKSGYGNIGNYPLVEGIGEGAACSGGRLVAVKS